MHHTYSSIVQYYYAKVALSIMMRTLMTSNAYYHISYIWILDRENTSFRLSLQNVMVWCHTPMAFRPLMFKHKGLHFIGKSVPHFFPATSGKKELNFSPFLWQYTKGPNFFFAWDSSVLYEPLLLHFHGEVRLLFYFLLTSRNVLCQPKRKWLLHIKTRGREQI